jgi:hypothetical protein
MRAAVAVRLAIRPRLQLSPEPPAASRKRPRLPSFALPAAGYWLVMAGLTYFFAHLGPSPLEQAFAAERGEPSLEPRPVAPAAAPEPVPSEPLAAEPPPVAPPLAPAELADATVEEPAPKAIEGAEPAEGARKALARVEPPASEPAFREPSSLPQLPAPSFPEFTDSSRPEPREHAADGPRIDGLFERRPEAPSAPAADAAAPSETKPERRRPLTSCEAAVARNNEQLDIGAPRGPADITREAYASILQNGRYLADCRVPERTVVEICAAVKQGRAVGITVVTNPASPTLEACVRGRVAGLTFPNNERLDVTHTRFDAATR